MTIPNLAEEAAEHLAPAYPGAMEAAMLAAMLAPLQRIANVVLHTRRAFAGAFDGTSTDEGVLRWAAQWYGRDPSAASTSELQDAAWIMRGWTRGSVPAIRSAIQPVLTGNRNVRLYERRDPADFDVDEPYHLTIVTTTSETPGGADSIINALRGVVPARIVLHIGIVDALSWQDLVDAELTWQDVLDDYEDWQHVYDGDPI